MSNMLIIYVKGLHLSANINIHINLTNKLAMNKISKLGLNMNK